MRQKYSLIYINCIVLASVLETELQGSFPIQIITFINKTGREISKSVRIF